MKENYQLFQLENGLTIASTQLPHSAIIAINILVKVGSRHESKSLNGISHLIEHMCFKGTKNFSATQIAEEFENLGAYFNAYTSREHTVFYVVGLREHYPRLLFLLSDIVFNSIYDQKELEKEKNVIFQEIAHSRDNPDEVVFEELQKLSYPDNLIGFPIIGNTENVKSFKKDDIIDFVRKNYTTNNMIISVAGNLDHELVKNTISQHFSKISNSSISKFDHPIFHGGIKLIEKELDQLHLALVFNGRDYHSKDYYAAHLLSAILGDGMSSRLFLEIRENLGLVYAIQSFMNPYHNAGTFGVFAGTDAANANQVLEKIAEQFAKIKENITDTELERAKNKFKAHLLMSREVTSQRSAELATDIAIYNRYIEPEEVVRKIDAVTKEKILTLASEIFSGKFAFSAIGKIKGNLDEEKILRHFG